MRRLEVFFFGFDFPFPLPERHRYRPLMTVLAITNQLAGRLGTARINVKPNYDSL
jgi:hypothetical protein